MLDLGQWVLRAERFWGRLRGVGGTLRKRWVLHDPEADSAIESIEEHLGLPLPPALRTLFAFTTACADWWYRWEPATKRGALELYKKLGSHALEGGFRIGPVGGMLSEQMKVPDEPAYAARAKRLRNIVPLFHFGDGDQLAVDLGASAKSPPVVFLSHDCIDDLQWEWRAVAVGVEEFLMAWESVQYSRDIYLLGREVTRPDGLVIGGDIDSRYFQNLRAANREALSW